MSSDVPGWCSWCGAELVQTARGRHRLYCTDTHRAQAHRYRTRKRECGLITAACLRAHGGVAHRWLRRPPSSGPVSG